MNFQQLKIIRESARCNYNLTEVANTLYTSQSGVSRHIREFEEELGVEIFVRRGKRLLGLTEPGKQLLIIAERILNEANNIRRIAQVFANDETGQLNVATTHAQARYSLPDKIKTFREQHPRVHMTLSQESPERIIAMLRAGEADIGIAGEPLLSDDALVTFPYYRWQHAILVPQGHPLSGESAVTLETLSAYPLITYHSGISGRAAVDAAFAGAGLTPEIVLSAQDSDVIKTYVELGLGVGIVAEMAYEKERDAGLVSLRAEGLFKANTVWLALKRNQLQRNFTWRFIQLCNPGLSLSEIKDKAFGNDDPAIDYQI